MEEKQPFILSNEQKVLILKRWEQLPIPSIMDLLELILPGQKLDGRSMPGISIKKLLSEHGLKAETKTEYKEKGPIKLTIEQEEFIRNNISTMPRPFEMAKEIFQNPRLSPASKEVKAVIEFVKTLPSYIMNNDEDGLEAEYKPPKRIEHVLARIFKYVKDNKIDKDKLTPQNKKCAEALIGYLHDYRLIHQINTYSEIDDKKLFESSFISYCWDKSDLSAEDVHLYIILCTEVVMSASIQRTINMLQAEQDRQMEEGEGKLSMSLIEAVNVARTEYNSSVKRQETLFKGLITERSKRLNERVGPQFTLLNIVEEMKNEERRKALILDAEKRNERIKDELKRLDSAEERICRIWGLDENLVING